ncbi:MAG TPA: hypothetical protein VGP09_18420 [Caballeronia sp.]|jgi:hypothetical protein|nr:hypothetical protein [Caballeronia sp.]
MDEQVNAQVQHSTLVPELLARTNYISTLPARLADRYRERPDIFELPFETRGFTLSRHGRLAVRPIRRTCGCVTRWLGSRQVKGQR